MPLSPLATTDDLEARGVDVTNTTLAETMLAVASAAVRGAAGSPISETTSTVTLLTWPDSRFVRLPGSPVQSVTEVLVEDVEVEDYKVDGDRIWRRVGWAYPGFPTQVVVTYTHGLTEVPADVVDLVCSFAIAGINAATDGDYGTRTGLIAERIDDYSVQYAQGAEAVSNVMDIPPRTRQLLRARFGAAAGMVASR